MTYKMKNLLIKMMLIVCVISFTFGAQSFMGFAVKADDSSIISMTAGASVNVTSVENSGLRFEAKVDKTAYDEIVATEGVTKVELGMMTVPTDMVRDAQENDKAFTIEDLSSYAPLNGYDYYAIASKISTVGENYRFKMTIPNISQSNYNRKFSARAFIKVTADTFENAEFTLYDGAYYSYAPYNETDNARSVYEIAYNTYVDRTAEEDDDHCEILSDGTYGVISEEGLEIAKTFIDGVAVVENNNGTIEIANNHTYYTSPYTVEKSGDNYFVSADPKGLIYEGERYKNLYAKDGNIMVSALLSKGATLTTNGASINSVGSVTAPGYFSQTLDKIMDNNYIAITGEYGVGTYMDFYFTGNNMPSVMFFADKVNGNMSGYASYTGSNGTAVGVNTGEKGLLITNGFHGQNETAITNACRNNFMVYGPNRIYLNNTSIGDTLKEFVSETALINKTYDAENTAYNAFTQTGLRNDYESTNFKYTVGTFSNKGELWIDATLYDVENKKIVGVIRESTGLLTSSITAGNIVIYGSVKGSSTTTDFTYVKPYTASADIVSSDATFNSDGSVTLAGRGVSGAGNFYQITSIDNSYVALTGDYGVGTYMDFTFTGNNMPTVAYFANNINGNMGNADVTLTPTGGYSSHVPLGNTGMIFTNGFYMSNSTNGGYDFYRIYGMN
ncbi:MAG: hypothetical protein IKB30_02425, partial [Clostridia bacterium]|nr:hypothetical protein [Clostridia bacterium]